MLRELTSVSHNLLLEITVAKHIYMDKQTIIAILLLQLRQYSAL
jgi:hypothetical protein